MRKNMFSKSKVRAFWNDHKELIVGVGAISAAVIGAVVVTKRAINIIDEQKTEADDLCKELLYVDETDFGRDCLMTFTVEETGEELGSIPVSELYTKDKIDRYNEFINDK